MSSYFQRLQEDEHRIMVEALDPFHKALTVINEEHRLIHDGFVYSIQTNEIDIPDGAARQVLYSVQDAPIHLKRFAVNASEGPILLTVYENPTYDDAGTPQLAPTINLNRMSSNTTTMAITRGPLLGGLPLAGLDRGDPVLGSLYIPAQGNQGVSGSTFVIEEIVLAANTDYLIEFLNDPLGAGTADVYASVVFYELQYEDNPRTRRGDT